MANQEGQALGHYTGPMVEVNGTLFVVNNLDDLGGWTAEVYAIQASSGTALWQEQSVALPNQQATVIGTTGEHVYLGTTEGSIIALRAADGETTWQARTSGSSVIALAASNSMINVTSLGGYLDAFDAVHGTRLWSYRIDQQQPSAPTIGP